MKGKLTYSKPNEKNQRVSDIVHNQNGTPFQCTLFLDTMTYKVSNKKTYTIARSTEKDGVGPAKTENYLKKQVRRALHSLGVRFKLITSTPGWKGKKNV